ncbi:MAG: hypothetical protein ABI547_10715, partial [Betaproteobacteria bacterium]
MKIKPANLNLFLNYLRSSAANLELEFAFELSVFICVYLWPMAFHFICVYLRLSAAKKDFEFFSSSSASSTAGAGLRHSSASA